MDSATVICEEEVELVTRFPRPICLIGTPGIALKAEEKDDTEESVEIEDAVPNAVEESKLDAGVEEAVTEDDEETSFEEHCVDII